MRIGYEISRHLKEVKSQEGNERTIRAMMVASALGYHFPVDPTKTVDENVETHLQAARKVISQINENLALDSKMALELFKQTITIRLELINGVTDPAIVDAAMRSHTASVHQTSEETIAVTALITNLDFMRAQNGIRQVLQTVVEE